jgi:DNA modification methylase
MQADRRDDPVDAGEDASESEERRPGQTHPRNTLNDLDGDRFLYFTKSVLTTAYPSVYSHALRRKHGANKPPQLMALLIEFFTKAGMTVLDPFAGVGGTLIGASIALPASRRAIGIEISQEWTQVYRQVLAENPEVQEQSLICGDALAVMDRLRSGERVSADVGEHVCIPADGFVDCILMDPPYNIHLPQTMSGTAGHEYTAEHRNRRSEYHMRTDDPRDLANLASYDAYLDAIGDVFERCFALLRPGRYMIVIVRDSYQQGRYVFTHVDLAQRAAVAGFVPKGEIIWYQAGSRLRPYGYPTAYVPNIVHQHIVVLRRPAVGERR